jgi:hypothetical protein
MLHRMTAAPEIRPLRMYSDAERDAVARELWGFAHWVDYVESGPTREERIERLHQVPAGWADAVAERCKKRVARAQREGRPG